VTKEAMRLETVIFSGECSLILLILFILPCSLFIQIYHCHFLYLLAFIYLYIYIYKTAADVLPVCFVFLIYFFTFYFIFYFMFIPVCTRDKREMLFQFSVCPVHIAALIIKLT